jgi:FMN phosphatase YigB (HAD superfamily)
MNDTAALVSYGSLPNVVLSALEQEVRPPRAICFDYFDTLVYRSVPPEETKVIASHRLSLQLGGLSGATLYEMRRELEARLCEQSAVAGGDPEFSLAALAAKMFLLLEGLTPRIHFFASQQDFQRFFCDVELAVEIEVQRIRPELVELLEALLAQNIETCVVSDFYLTKDLFRRLLDHHSLSKYFKRLFISADYGVSKGCGRLYHEVSRGLGCAPTDLWMIGDNLHADRIMAERTGLRSFLVDAREQRRAYCQYNPQNRAEVRAGDWQIIQSDFDDIVQQSGAPVFPEMGASIWYFVIKLFYLLRDGHVRHVFFCSKEGEFLKRLFDLFQEKAFGCRPISSHYLLVSRKSTFICSLKALEEEDFGGLLQQYRDLTLEEFVQSLNFSKEDLSALQREFVVDWKVRLPNIGNHQHFHRLLALPEFKKRYEEHRSRQRDSFLRYLNSFGVDFHRHDLHLVDVGWRGSIQNNIFNALSGSVAVHGYYIGLLTPSGLEERNRKTGVLFTDFPSLSPFVHVYNNNRSLFEMLLGASHGSADGYFPLSGGESQAVARGGSIHLVTPGSNEVVVSVLDLPEERKLYEERIAPLQASYLAMAERCTSIYLERSCPSLSPRWFAERHARMLFSPRKAEVEFFAGLYHLENFGLFEFTTFDATGRVGLVNRLRNLRLLLNNPAGLLESGVWPPIILRRLGLSFLQPLDGWKRNRRIFKGQT